MHRATKRPRGVLLYVAYKIVIEYGITVGEYLGNAVSE